MHKVALYISLAFLLYFLAHVYHFSRVFLYLYTLWGGNYFWVVVLLRSLIGPLIVLLCFYSLNFKFYL
ncbi:hypothetical protein PRUPE_4G179700 [Prunus persica]|uniref:Uncharacterized protein n=1 Tax=Prunus persica TaxID=3760 RepID=A0A251PMC1_PRUPE|nr:hypothetical protein PRUPE_4G179700 [Prunus persica]